MTLQNMLKLIDQPSAPETQGLGEAGTEVSVEDDRWLGITGLLELIPSLVSETLRGADLNPGTCSVSVALLSNEAIQTLNKIFRGRDAGTNVLSFPAAPSIVRDGAFGVPNFLGDLALGYETVTEEASIQAKPALHHTAHLVVHGTLHLLGFDHAGEAEAERMEALERITLSRFGIPDPYGDDVSPARSVL